MKTYTEQDLRLAFQAGNERGAFIQARNYFDYTIITSKDRDFNDENCFDSAKRIYDKDTINKRKERKII